MNTEEILNRAHARAAELKLPYAGALLPTEAAALLKARPGQVVLVDVRTQAEWDYVGHVPNAVEVQWQTYPGGKPNPEFINELKAKIRANSGGDDDVTLLFLCRSGARSDAAAAAATAAGFSESYNILQGFEGDRDANHHRNTIGGWRAAGLPWIQS